MSSGSQSTSSTQQQTVPPWLTEGQQNLVGQSQNLTGPFLNLPAFRTAGFTPDQTNAFDLTRSMADAHLAGRDRHRHAFLVRAGHPAVG